MRHGEAGRLNGLIDGGPPMGAAGGSRGIPPGRAWCPDERKRDMSNEHDQKMMTLARALPAWSIPDIILARKCAGKIHRADEAQCNGDAYLADETGAWRDRHGRPCRNPYGRAAKTLDNITAGYGWTWYHQSDPRGASVYLLSLEAVLEMAARGVTLDQGYNRGVAL